MTQTCKRHHCSGLFIIHLHHKKTTHCVDSGSERCSSPFIVSRLTIRHPFHEKTSERIRTATITCRISKCTTIMQGMLTASTCTLETNKSITRSIDRKSLVPLEFRSASTDRSIDIHTSTREETSGEGPCRIVDNNCIEGALRASQLCGS